MTGSSSSKHIAFLTGTRADFGKLKPLVRAVEAAPGFTYSIYATGMHLISRYGLTVNEIHKAGFQNVMTFMNQFHGEPMELILANTINGLSRYAHEYRPDMLVIHGDRVESLAGAVVGSLQNLLVGHVEGGEVSGTIDELLRHATSKMAHIHFVSNEKAKDRLEQLGELSTSIYVIGSPDIDIMLSDAVPPIEETKTRYGVGFDDYAIAIFHPVTTERDQLPGQASSFVESLIESGENYIVIYPNNDEGSKDVFRAYERLGRNERFHLFPSLRFEYFLSLLRHARFIVGNSSAGIHEAPVYGIPTVNVGTRQQGRSSEASIVHCGHTKGEIVAAIGRAKKMGRCGVSTAFGDGRSADRFLSALQTAELWDTPKQKRFQDRG